jgi:hypothetical protein
MNLFAVAVLLLMGLTMFVMVRGQRRNRDFASALSRRLEMLFKPTRSSYRNIGGVVGYHFTYDLEPPYSRLQGTMTFFPRHTLFYYPIARLLRREDELRFSLSGDFFAIGEAHVVSAARHGSGWVQITEEGDMSKKPVEIGGEQFVAFYFYEGLADRMIAFLREVPHPDCLRHFACFGTERLFYFHMEPRLETVDSTISAILERLPSIVE